MDCFIAKLIGSAGSEKEVRFYSSSARRHLEYYHKNEMTLWHNDIYDILADACVMQKHYARKDDITASQMRNTQRDISSFKKEAPQKERYHIKEFAPCPKKNTK